MPQLEFPPFHVSSLISARYFPRGKGPAASPEQCSRERRKPEQAEPCSLWQRCTRGLVLWDLHGESQCPEQFVKCFLEALE